MEITRTQSRRTFVPWLLVGTLVAAASIAAIVGASTSRHVAPKSASAPQVEAPPTGFGGYQWPGAKVDEIEAEWRVPRVVGTAQNAGESTWIGVQGPGTDEPFIQLGTLANAEDSPLLGSAGGTRAEASSAPQLGQTDYEIFWSDTTQDFHPVPIAQLKRPGDLILFKMTRESQGWELNVRNLTYGWDRSELVRYGQGDSFTRGEWLQEDPASYTPGVDLPYADTSSVTFQRVRVNDAVPKFRYRDEGALSTQDGVYLVPSPFVKDGFSMMRPTGAALQYISDAEIVDVSLSRIGAQIDWLDNGNADASQVSRVKQLAGLYSQSAHIVDVQTWPASARKASVHFVTSYQGLAQGLEKWVNGNGHSVRQLRTIFDAEPALDAANNLRRALRLPPV